MIIGGHSTFFALLNTFVHIVMYFYYMLSAMGPEYQKYIWWKKYLTSFQMIQFVMIFTHQFQLLFTECNYPKIIMVWIALHGMMFLFLFSDFYKTKYAGTKTAVRRNQGFCMPVEVNQDERSNGTSKSLTNSYLQTDIAKTYQACYSNGVNNGFVSQEIKNRANGKKHHKAY